MEHPLTSNQQEHSVNQRVKPQGQPPLRPPVTGSSPAFPHPANAGAGITYRAWLAAHAPREIPTWFSVTSNVMPNAVLPWHKRPQAAGLLSATLDQIALCLGAGEDLPPNFEWAAEAHAEFLKQQEISHTHNMLQRYFTWPFHWADMMIRAEEQTAQANLMQQHMEQMLSQQAQDAANSGTMPPTQ
jgi:hypothetical protein